LPHDTFRIVDATLIGAGLTITILALFFPPTSALAGVAISAAAGAAIGGGSGGLWQDVFTDTNAEATGNEDAEWTKQVVFGAVIGAIAGGVGGVVDVQLTAFSVRASLSGRTMLAGVIRTGQVKFVAKVTSEAALGAFGGAVQQIVTNWEAGEDPWRDVGRSSLVGGIQGLTLGFALKSKWMTRSKSSSHSFFAGGGRYLKLRGRAPVRSIQKLKSGPDPKVNPEYSDYVLYRGLPPFGHNLDFPYMDAAPPSFGENFDFPFIDA
jgi:hypothetical protein